MADLAVSTPTIDVFFRRWEASGAAERANYSMFLNELCDLLDVPRPDPAGPDDEKNAYVFERAVPFPNPDGSTTVKRIDLYKRDRGAWGQTEFQVNLKLGLTPQSGVGTAGMRRMPMTIGPSPPSHPDWRSCRHRCGRWRNSCGSTMS